MSRRHRHNRYSLPLRAERSPSMTQGWRPPSAAAPASRLSAFGSRLSAFGFRLSAFGSALGFRLSDAAGPVTGPAPFAAHFEQSVVRPRTMGRWRFVADDPPAALVAASGDLPSTDSPTRATDDVDLQGPIRSTGTGVTLGSMPPAQVTIISGIACDRRCHHQVISSQFMNDGAPCAGSSGVGLCQDGATGQRLGSHKTLPDRLSHHRKPRRRKRDPEGRRLDDLRLAAGHLQAEPAVTDVDDRHRDARDRGFKGTLDRFSRCSAARFRLRHGSSHAKSPGDVG